MRNFQICSASEIEDIECWRRPAKSTFFIKLAATPLITVVLNRVVIMRGSKTGDNRQPAPQSADVGV